MTTLDARQLLEKTASELRAYMRDRDITAPVFIGIRTGGVWVTEHLQSLLDDNSEPGVLDITFYRDDFSRAGIQPTVKPSRLPRAVDDRHVILVDDVLYTGRTVRAALNEIFDYGRPASINLVTLVQRNGRELPVQADVVGASLDLSTEQHVKLSGPDPLTLKIVN